VRERQSSARAPAPSARTGERKGEREGEREGERGEVQPEFSIWVSCSSCSDRNPRDVVRILLSAIVRTSGEVFSESINVEMQE
jgi:hypothetical protein